MANLRSTGQRGRPSGTGKASTMKTRSQGGATPSTPSKSGTKPATPASSGKRPGRPPKKLHHRSKKYLENAAAAAVASADTSAVTDTPVAVAVNTSKRRGRPPKNPVPAEQTTDTPAQAEDAENDAPAEDGVIEATQDASTAGQAPVEAPSTAPEKPKRKPGRPPKRKRGVKNTSGPHVNTGPAAADAEPNKVDVLLAAGPSSCNLPPARSDHPDDTHGHWATEAFHAPKRRGRPPARAVSEPVSTSQIPPENDTIEVDDPSRLDGVEVQIPTIAKEEGDEMANATAKTKKGVARPIKRAVFAAPKKKPLTKVAPVAPMSKAAADDSARVVGRPPTRSKAPSAGAKRGVADLNLELGDAVGSDSEDTDDASVAPASTVSAKGREKQVSEEPAGTQVKSTRGRSAGPKPVTAATTTTAKGKGKATKAANSTAGKATDGANAAPALEAMPASHASGPMSMLSDFDLSGGVPALQDPAASSLANQLREAAYDDDPMDPAPNWDLPKLRADATLAAMEASAPGDTQSDGSSHFDRAFDSSST